MRILRDYEGRGVRLTEERLSHILEHPEMVGLERSLEETLRRPTEVVQSFSDAQARLYYRLYVGTVVGTKLLCVVVKVADNDAFVLTAYLTDKVKRGIRIWPKGT